jgi:radical SAM superfamily enzyme YgiQ (UPF0313 family)
LACLAAYVRDKGHQAACFDLDNDLYHASPASRKMWDPDRYSFWEDQAEIDRLLAENAEVVDGWVRAILDTGAPVIGFATQTTSYLMSLALAERIKSEDPGRLVLFGGAQCSRERAAFAFAADPRVDAVVVGEGEATLVAVLSNLERAGRLEPVPGLIFRRDGAVVDGGDRAPIMDMESLPFPDYSDFRDGILAGRYEDKRRLDLCDSRGCVRRCAFCSDWQFWGKFRSKSGRRVLDEVRHQMSLYPGISHFYFDGLLLNGNLRELSRFCDLVLSEGVKFTWAGQAIVQPGMDGPMLKKMAAAGCVWLGYGIESGSEELRWRIAKKFTNENAFRTLRATHEAGIRSQINLMFGTPGESQEDFDATLSFLVRARPHIDSVLASQSFCTVEKNTLLYREADLRGIVDREHHLFWESDCGANNYPERFRRYEEFCRLALFLKLPETSGVLERKPDKWFLLGSYRRYKKEYVRAISCYRRSQRREATNPELRSRLDECYAALGRSPRVLARS